MTNETLPTGGGQSNPRRSVRTTRYALIAGAAAVVVAGGGSVAWAASGASNGPSHPAQAPRYGYGAPTGTPPAARAVTPSIEGTVKSVDGTQITVKDFQGFTRVIVTSASTAYKNGLTSSPAAGTRIRAEGKVDSNGTSLDATVVDKAQDGPGGPGGFGGPGRGGPRPGQPAPSASATA